jgi:Flp pilus assembly protein TadG
MTLVFVALGFMGLFAATMLAVDVGMLMTARSQSQNSADAGALAGAVALGFDDFDDRSATGPATTSALNAAQTNTVMGATVSVIPDDVVYSDGPNGEARVQVTVRRTADRGNPVSTFIASLFGIDTMDVGATATAEVSPANAMTCVKPFTIPDKWTERTSPPWNSSESTFEKYYTSGPNKGQLRPDADVYIPATDKVNYTGYNTEKDRGTLLMIRAGTGNNINPSMYFSLALSWDTGGSDYEWNIANCNQSIMHWDEKLLHEPGNMMGPTVDGIRDLIAKDPNAFWDTGCKCVKNSAYGGQSPRVFPIPLYDPTYYEDGKHEGRYADLKVANWIGFFVVEVVSNNIYGRIIPIGGIRSGSGPSADAVFPIAIRLIK